MTTEEPNQESPLTDRRALASYETGFWAFLEYPSFWIPCLGFTVFMLIVLTVLMVTGMR